MPRPPRPDPQPLLADVAAALDAEAQPAASFAALAKALGTALGYTLFSVLRHDAAGGFNERVFSNRPEYPLGGRKMIVDSAWTRQVIREGRPYIGRSAADIAATYPDATLLTSLGIESSLNLPVRWRGRTLGTVNLLHTAGWYDDADAAIGMVFAALAAPALLGLRDGAVSN